MNKTTSQPELQHLILLGGGHAQVTVLKDLAMRPIPGLRVTLISRDIMTPYSGMLPGFMEGHYDADEITIDLSHLARHAGVRFIHGEVKSMDTRTRTVTLEGRPPLYFDLLSINIGSSPDPASVTGAEQHSTPIKPISTLIERFDAIIKRSEGQHIAIIGGGAAGVEVALALKYRMREIDGTKISIIHRGERLVPEYPESAARRLNAICQSRGISVHCGHAVKAVAADHLLLADDSRFPVDHALLITAGRAPSWLAETGLRLDSDGFISVNEHLQSTSHDFIFASGDIAGLGFAPRPKAGVFAVRAGDPLSENLRRKLLGKPLRLWKPQRKYLALIGLGGRRALPVRGARSMPPSWFAWKLKEWIDRKFMRKYTELAEMEPPLPSPLAAQINAEDDPALAKMRCLGCGGKAGHGTLHDALEEATRLTKAYFPNAAPLNPLTSDSSTTEVGGGKVVQSVDALSAIVDDPFFLGIITVRHALSDLFASNARPLSAHALITLPPAVIQLQQDDISQLMTGAMLALQTEGAVLAGGHTSEGDSMQLGFSVTGVRENGEAMPPREGDVLILTKPLGVGIIMAAHGQGERAASGLLRARAIDTMLQSNGRAARIIARHGTFSMTDVSGFGLIRHTLSLLSRGEDALSATIRHNSLPVLPGVDALIDRGIQSSLAALNRKSAPPIMEIDVPQTIYHDPQTGGGLLAAVPPSLADAVLSEVKAAGIPAAAIGVISSDRTARVRVKE